MQFEFDSDRKCIVTEESPGRYTISIDPYVKDTNVMLSINGCRFEYAPTETSVRGFLTDFVEHNIGRPLFDCRSW